MDPIGMWKGKPINDLSREELLEFAVWAGPRIGPKQAKKKAFNSEYTSDLMRPIEDFLYEQLKHYSRNHTIVIEVIEN